MYKQKNLAIFINYKTKWEKNRKKQEGAEKSEGYSALLLCPGENTVWLFTTYNIPY